MPRKPFDLEALGMPMGTFILLAHTGQKLHHRIENSGGYGDLTSSQFYSLMALDDLGSLPLSKISEHIRRSPGNMTLVIDNLEKEGLVERQRSTEDRRVIMIAMTEEGKKRIKAAKASHRAVIEKEMSVLTAEEILQLRNLLLKFHPEHKKQLEEAFKKKEQ